MVELRGFKLNEQLAAFLRKHRTEIQQQSPNHSPSLLHRHRRWRIRDRLSSQDIADIVSAFKPGTPKHVLAERYGMHLRSLKKLLWEEGVKQRSRWDVQL